MDIKTVKKSGTQIEFEVEISTEEFKRFFDKAASNARQKITVKGFRKEAVPQNIIEEKFGKENLLIEAADLAIKETYFEAIQKLIKENKIKPIAQPKIDILKIAPGSPFQFRAEVSILPEIKLPDYKQIIGKIKKNKIEASEEEIKNTLKWLQKSRAKFIFKNEPAQKGDFVEIEYQTSGVEGELNPESKKDSFILGEGGFVPGFEEKIIGMKTGEEKEKISLVIPVENSKDKSFGKEINLKVKIKSVQKMEFPELSDEFVKSIGQFENLDALRKNIKEGIFFEKKEAERQRIRSEILEKISQKIEFEIPVFLIEQEKERMMHNLKHEAEEHLKIPFNDYLAKIKKTEKELSDSILEKAKQRIKNFLILKEISDKENIQVSEQEIKKEINGTLKKHSDIKEATKNIDLERLKEYTEESIKSEKVFKLLESFVFSNT